MYMYHYDELIKKNNTILNILGEGNGNLLQCSCLVCPMDRGAWGPAVHGVAKSPTGLSIQTSNLNLSMPFIPTSTKEDLMYPLAKEARTPTQASLRQIFLVTFSF